MLKARHTPGLEAMLLVLILAIAPRAAWASEHDQPMPYQEFVALVQGWDGGITEWSPGPTYAQLIIDAEAAIVRGEERVVALEAIVPEPCYAAAHEEMIDYHQSAIAELAGLRQVIESTPSIAELVAEIVAVDTRLVEEHPTAFVEPDQPAGTLGTGKRLDLPNVPRQLATCDEVGRTDPGPEVEVFAPADLAALIPRTVGPISLVIESDADRDADAVIASGPFLEQFDRTPSDLTGALGSGQTSDLGVRLGIFAIRIAGIPAEQVYEPWLREIGLDLTESPQRWVEEDQRRYLLIGPDAAGASIVAYPKGEVLFVAFVLGISPAEVMETLP